jgi:HAD domain family 1 in Swiss Army Knife RNA repair proteins
MLNFRKFMENQQSINRLVIFDFDDTLVFTPSPEEGMPAYEKATGKPWKIADSETALAHGYKKDYRRLGWWGRDETLKPPIFNQTIDKLNIPVAQAFHAFRNDPQTYVVVMTGRTAKSEQTVKEILTKYGIHADAYFFQGQKALTQHPNYPKVQDTYAYKTHVIQDQLLPKFPDLQSVEIFDDREEHIPRFVQFGENLRKVWPNLQSVTIHDVKQNKIYKL